VEGKVFKEKYSEKGQNMREKHTSTSLKEGTTGGGGVAHLFTGLSPTACFVGEEGSLLEESYPKELLHPIGTTALRHGGKRIEDMREMLKLLIRR